MPTDLRNLLEQAEQSRAEVLRAAVELARRLRAADPEAAEGAASAETFSNPPEDADLPRLGRLSRKEASV